MERSHSFALFFIVILAIVYNLLSLVHFFRNLTFEVAFDTVHISHSNAKCFLVYCSFNIVYIVYKNSTISHEVLMLDVPSFVYGLERTNGFSVITEWHILVSTGRWECHCDRGRCQYAVEQRGAAESSSSHQPCKSNGVPAGDQPADILAGTTNGSGE